MTSTRVVFYGHFGGQNFGNECTLQALLLNLRRRLPDAEMLCVCSDPADVWRRHGIPAVLISTAAARPERQGEGRSRSLAPVRFLGKLYRRLAGEIVGIREAFKTLKGSRLFVVAGTGVLEDTAWSAVWYYDILKWCLVARLRGCRVCFVSVGMGPIRNPLSQMLTRAALWLADYVSYRDRGSKDYGASISLDTSTHHLFPDLAFSLPLGTLPAPEASRSGPPVIGVGVMDYYGPQDAAPRDDLHELYLQKTSRVVVWLIERGYRVRMLYGDARYDPPVLAEVLRRLAQQGGTRALAHIEAPSLQGVADVLAAVSATDIVIAPRFHNLVLALVLGKPAMSLSYHPKNDDLLNDFGLADYCHSLEEFDVERCIRQFEALVGNADYHAADIRRRAAERRRLLDHQYELLLGDRPANSLDHRVAAAEA